MRCWQRSKRNASLGPATGEGDWGMAMFNIQTTDR
jgi:hypothetical protein